MGIEAGIKPEDAWEERLMDEFFDTSRTVVGSHGNTVAQLRESPRSTASDEAYASMCKVADLMFSRLPENWRGQYQKDLKSGKTPYNMLQPEIRRIVREMDIDIEA